MVNKLEEKLQQLGEYLLKNSCESLSMMRNTVITRKTLDQLAEVAIFRH